MSTISKELLGITMQDSPVRCGEDGLDLKKGKQVGGNLKRWAQEECVFGVLCCTLSNRKKARFDTYEALLKDVNTKKN